MVKSLPVDLRERVIVAIQAGSPCRQAATRFGVSASSAIRWHRLSKGNGVVTPQLQGGDRRSRRIEGHAGCDHSGAGEGTEHHASGPA